MGESGSNERVEEAARGPRVVESQSDRGRKEKGGGGRGGRAAWKAKAKEGGERIGRPASALTSNPVPLNISLRAIRAKDMRRGA